MLLDPSQGSPSPPSEAGELRLTGEMDIATAETMLEPAYRLLADGHRHIVLDGAGVTFCDSQGLNAMLRLLNAVPPGGSVTVVEASEALFTLLTLTGLLDRFGMAEPLPGA